MSSSLEAKIVVLGSQGVGKTSLVMRYCKGSFNPSQITSTVGASFLTKRVIDTDTDTLVRLQIWDTAGQERFRSISRLYYRGANACILCYSVTDARSFAEMGMWLTELRRNLPPDIVLHVVGTKADIVARDPSRREVPFERCIAYVAENLNPGMGSTPPPTASAAVSPGPGGFSVLPSPFSPSQQQQSSPQLLGVHHHHTNTSGGGGGGIEPRSPSSKRSSGFWGQEVGWDACHEISAETGEGVEEVFRVVTRKLVEQNRKMQAALLAATAASSGGYFSPDWYHHYAAAAAAGNSPAGSADLAAANAAAAGGYFEGVTPRGGGGSFRVGRDRRSWLFSPGFSPAVGIGEDGYGPDGDRRGDADGRQGRRCC